MNEAQRRVELLLQTIYVQGDQDECALKHVCHGIAMTKEGVDPSIQENYVDYGSAGFSEVFTDYDRNLFVESGFQKYLWKEIKEQYDKHGESLFDECSFADSYCEFYRDYYNGEINVR